MVKIICPKCQKPLEEEYKFCIFCGTPLENQPTVAAQEEAQVSVTEPVESAPKAAAKNVPVIPPEEDKKPSLQSVIVNRVAESGFRKFMHVIKVIALVLWWVSFGLITLGAIIPLLTMPLMLLALPVVAAIVIFVWILIRNIIIRPILFAIEVLFISIGTRKLQYNPYKALKKYGHYHEYVQELPMGEKKKNYIERLSVEVFDLSQTARCAGFLGLILLAIEKVLTFIFKIFNSFFGIFLTIPLLLGILVIGTGVAGLFNGMGSTALVVIGIGVACLVVAAIVFVIFMVIGFLQELVVSVFSTPRILKIKSFLKKEAASWIELYGYEEEEEENKENTEDVTEDKPEAESQEQEHE